MKRPLRSVIHSVTVLFVLFLCSAAAVAGIRKGPYLIYEGSNTAMAVLWQTTGTESNTIRWGTDTSYTMGQATVGVYGADYQHKQVISGLQPETTYYYQIDGYGSGSFRTAPGTGASSVKLLAYGDTRTYPAAHEQVASRMRATYGSDPAFQTLLLHSGDWVGSDTESDWTSYYFVSESTCPQMHALQAEVPVTGVRGNHEGSGTVFRKYFPYPYVGAFYWSFDYGPVHVTVLDQYTTYASGSAQYNWLVSDLSSSTKSWKIVLAHEPGWGAGTHANNTEVQNILHPLFRQYGVALFINGHNHNYVRAVVDGIHYVTTGGGGAPLYAPDPGYPNVVKTDTSNHHLEIDVRDALLAVTARRANGTVIETVSITRGNQAPVADAGADQNVSDTDGSGSESVVLDGSASSDPDGTISSYVWKEGSVQIATGATPVVNLAVGTHTITLTVTDNAGATAADTVVVAVGTASAATTVTSQVSAGSDDAEERQNRGKTTLTSSDLELVYDTPTTGNQHVGLRFRNVNVPKGKTITSAYIQFTVDKITSGVTSLIIKGQAADSPGSFTTGSYNISSRAKSTSTVSWSPAAWTTVDAAGTDQRTPDLKTIVQEIVNRPGWVQNNAMVFIITGTGKRTARAYESSASKAPKLVITYQ